jgi:hypothetical protein
VTGDRNRYCPEMVEGILNRLLLRYGPDLVVIHGAATDIDRSFALACGELEIEQEAHPARSEELSHPYAYCEPHQSATSADGSGVSVPFAGSMRAGEAFTTELEWERKPEEFRPVRYRLPILNPSLDHSDERTGNHGRFGGTKTPAMPGSSSPRTTRTTRAVAPRLAC